jgi:hypothetical protein
MPALNAHVQQHPLLAHLWSKRATRTFSLSSAAFDQAYDQAYKNASDISRACAQHVDSEHVLQLAQVGVIRLTVARKFDWISNHATHRLALYFLRDFGRGADGTCRQNWKAGCSNKVSGTVEIQVERFRPDGRAARSRSARGRRPMQSTAFNFRRSSELTLARKVLGRGAMMAFAQERTR